MVVSQHIHHPPGQERSHWHFMTIGKGTTYMALCKQKLKTKSFKKAYLVSIDEAMGQMLWNRHFLAEQGQHVPTTTIYEDIKITILLAENVRISSSNRTLHLNVGYFFMTKLKMELHSSLTQTC